MKIDSTQNEISSESEIRFRTFYSGSYRWIISGLILLSIIYSCSLYMLAFAVNAIQHPDTLFFLPTPLPYWLIPGIVGASMSISYFTYVIIARFQFKKKLPAFHYWYFKTRRLNIRLFSRNTAIAGLIVMLIPAYTCNQNCTRIEEKGIYIGQPGGTFFHSPESISAIEFHRKNSNEDWSYKIQFTDSRSQTTLQAFTGMEKNEASLACLWLSARTHIKIGYQTGSYFAK